MDAATLPDLDQLDFPALKSIILAQHEQARAHRKQLTTQQEEILSQRKQLASRDVEIEHLELLIAKLRRMKFGRSSERRENQIEQLELRLEELEARRSRETAAVKEAAPAGPAAARPVRRPLPEHLPREVRKFLPKQAACPDCGGQLKHLGEDVSEILEYVPASVKVIQYLRPKLACAGCDRIVQAAAPSRPLERSIAGPGLLAHILTSGNYMRMTRPFRCWRQGWVKLKQDDCGPTCATIVRQEIAHPLRCGSRIHRTARANIRAST